MPKPELCCSKCKHPYHYKKTTPAILKLIENIIPIKIFFCAKCVQNRYLVISRAELNKYWI